MSKSQTDSGGSRNPRIHNAVHSSTETGINVCLHINPLRCPVIVRPMCCCRLEIVYYIGPVKLSENYRRELNCAVKWSLPLITGIICSSTVSCDSARISTLSLYLNNKSLYQEKVIIQEWLTIIDLLI